MDVGADDNAEAMYTLSIFGAIYPYREFFDAANITGGHVKQQDGNRDKNKMKSIFEQVLLNVPVYLVDSTRNPNDELVAWMCNLPSVELGETSS